MSTSREVATDLIKPAHFAHFVVRVSNLDASIDWYRTVLGMEIVYQNPMIAFMTYDDEHHRMALVQVGADEKMSKQAPGSIMSPTRSRPWAICCRPTSA